MPDAAAQSSTASAVVGGSGPGGFGAPASELYRHGWLTAADSRDRTLDQEVLDVGNTRRGCSPGQAEQVKQPLLGQHRVRLGQRCAEERCTGLEIQ